ncbi:MAG TPA: VPLPA-CTERM sorting domain-containing protein [Steroidobacteraceae bacterium]|nr:VPLPA-CTERM sorting domain-containing protein [Steroidobacteraceae bacterium]
MSALAAAVALTLGTLQAHGATVELPLGQTVDGISPLHADDFIDNFYDGGDGSNSLANSEAGVYNVGPGPNLGFQFSANAAAPGSALGSTSGKFEYNPSGLSQVLYFAYTSSAITNTVNFAAGFNDVSFNYAFSANDNYSGQTINIYSGLNGTGTLLDSLTLTGSNYGVDGCSTSQYAYCTWYSLTSGQLSGVAESITFGSSNGASEFTEFDGLSVNAVPLPAAGWLLMSGLGGVAAMARRRRVTA